MPLARSISHAWHTVLLLPSSFGDAAAVPGLAPSALRVSPSLQREWVGSPLGLFSLRLASFLCSHRSPINRHGVAHPIGRSIGTAHAHCDAGESIHAGQWRRQRRTPGDAAEAGTGGVASVARRCCLSAGSPTLLPHHPSICHCPSLQCTRSFSAAAALPKDFNGSWATTKSDYIGYGEQRQRQQTAQQQRPAATHAIAPVDPSLHPHTTQSARR